MTRVSNPVVAQTLPHAEAKTTENNDSKKTTDSTRPKNVASGQGLGDL